MEAINIRNILNAYKMFSKRQTEILENLFKKKESFTFDDLQKELQEDSEAKELLEKIRFIVNSEYEKAGVAKATFGSKYKSTTANYKDEIELHM